jgi:hypothetical protein
MLEALDGPYGDAVRDGARDVQGREGVEALDTAAGCVADSCDARSIAGAVLVVDLLDYRRAHRFSCLPDAAGRLHARDGGDQARAGNPEARRHLAPPLVLDNARQAERATGGDAERARSTPELPCDGVVVSRGFGHQATGIEDLSA